MDEEPENLIVRLLQDMRADIAARDEKTQAQIASLAQGQLGIRNEMKDMRKETKDFQKESQAELKEILGKIFLMQSQIHEIAIVLDHNSTRLDRIEQHLGLDSAKH